MLTGNNWHRFNFLQRDLKGSGICLTQHFKSVFHPVKTIQQGLKILAGCRVRTYIRNFRLNMVRHFTESHGTCQTGAAFEGMQYAQNFLARALVVRALGPLTQCGAEARHQLCTFFFKNREKVEVNRIDSIDVVVIECRSGGVHGSGYWHNGFCNGLRCHHSFNLALILDGTYSVNNGFLRHVSCRLSGALACGRKVVKQVKRIVFVGFWRIRTGELQLSQLIKEARLRLLQEAFGKLVQQAAYVFRSLDKQRPIGRGAMVMVSA